MPFYFIYDFLINLCLFAIVESTSKPVPEVLYDDSRQVGRDVSSSGVFDA